MSINPSQNNQIVYPQGALIRRDGGTVVVDLIFKDAESKPEISIYGETLASELKKAVYYYVSRYRMPCMKPGDQKISLRQSFTFNPYDSRPVVNYPVENNPETERDVQLACMVNINGAKYPEYPRESRIGSVDEGTFYYKVTFIAADQPPTLEWIAAAEDNVLQASIERFASGLRLPCLTKGPVSRKILYSFQRDSGSRVYLKDMTLKQLVDVARPISKPAKFDFNTMDCPFDVRMTYMQPFDSNDVREYENVVPSRRPLIDWLSKITLIITDKESIRVIGNVFTIKVPCDAGFINTLP